jgi:hypothetical protein
VQADLRQKNPGISGGSADPSLLIHQISRVPKPSDKFDWNPNSLLQSS